MKGYLNYSFSSDDFDLVSIIDELPLWSAPFGLDLLDTVRPKFNTIALDVGSGLGFPMIELALRLGASGKVFGIDPWERAVQRARLKLKVLNLKNAEVIKCVAERMPFKDNYFDLIVSNNGLNNVDDMKLSLAECKRVSKPGAQFVMTFNLNSTMMEFYNEFEETLDRNGLTEEIVKMKAHIYIKRKPLEEVESLLKKTGFKISVIKHQSFKMNFLDGTTMFNHFLIKHWFLPGWKHIVKEEDQEMIFDQVEKRLNKLASENGFITLTIPYVVIDGVRK